MALIDAFFLATAYVGLVVLLVRMWPRPSASREKLGDEASWPRVSLIVPARNEEATLGKLLASLEQLDYPAYEVIVVDDQSEDRTAEIAAAFDVRLVSGTPRPEGWAGKQWACHQGAQVATGKILIFTDADTIHEPTGLKNVVSHLEASGLQMTSVPPFHVTEKLWERLVGPFQILLMAITAPYGEPRPRRVYAIGQYLVFRRDFYRALGGHESVRACFVEDLPLANRCLAEGGRYGVFHAAIPVYRVRMYATLGDFVKGWRRNFRAGMADSEAGATLEVAFIISAVVGAGQLATTWLAWPPVVAAMLFMAWRQRRMGDFSLLGALVPLVSLGLFCWVSLLAAGDRVLRRDLVWKGRSYGANAPRTATEAARERRAF